MPASPTIKNREQLPEWAKPVADQITSLGFTWEFDYQYPVTDAYTTQRVQIRDEGHTGQKSEVGKYAEAMKRGAQFPPGVVTKDGRYVDFNTRARAAHKNGWLHYPVFIINIDFGKATENDQNRARLLGASFNTKGPKPLTREEQARLIKPFAGNKDWKAEKLAEHLGVTPATVNSVFAQVRAEQEASRLGVPFNGTVSPTVRTALGGKLDKLTDPLFRELTRLTQDAGLGKPEVNELCKKMQETPGSEEDKLAVISSWRTERGPQISHYKASGKPVPPKSVELRRRMASSSVTRTTPVTWWITTRPAPLSICASLRFLHVSWPTCCPRSVRTCRTRRRFCRGVKSRAAGGSGQVTPAARPDH